MIRSRVYIVEMDLQNAICTTGALLAYSTDTARVVGLQQLCIFAVHAAVTPCNWPRAISADECHQTLVK